MIGTGAKQTFFLGIFMRSFKFLRTGVVVLLAIVLLTGAGTVRSQQLDPATRLNELRRLQDELRLSNALQEADVVVMMSERAFIEGLRQFVGLEIVLSNGSTVRITSFDGELQTGAAAIKVGLQSKSKVTVNLQLAGRIGTGERGERFFKIPYQVTNVTLMNGKLSGMFLKTLFGEWLSPGKWNEELPTFELPIEYGDFIHMPAGRMDIAGSVPVELKTPEYRPAFRFALTSFLVLNRRALLGLKMIEQSGMPDRPSIIPTSYAGSVDPGLIESEIETMAQGLMNTGDLHVRMSRRLVNRMLEQIVTAKDVDFDIRLKPGRLRADEIDTLVKVTNYTDIEGGEGRADIRQLSLEKIDNGRLNFRISGQGEIDARLRGKEFGVPYSLSPRTTFNIKDAQVPMQFVSEGDHVVLQAVPGATLPVDLRFSLMIAGRDLGINRSLTIEADQWLKRIELPSFFGRRISLPRKIEIDAGGNLYVTESTRLDYNLSKVRIDAREGALDFVADVSVARQASAGAKP